MVLLHLFILFPSFPPKIIFSQIKRTLDDQFTTKQNRKLFCGGGGCDCNWVNKRHGFKFPQESGTEFTNFNKFLMWNPANFLLAPLSGVLLLACPLTYQDIPDNS
jgi:hypothetical protein